MAIEIKYDDLQKKVQEKIDEKAVNFTAKDGKVVVIRPLGMLPDADLKAVRVYLKELEKHQDSEENDLEKLGELMNLVLVAASDKKESMKKSLVDFPVDTRVDIFNAWMGVEGEQGEGSNSES